MGKMLRWACSHVQIDVGPILQIFNHSGLTLKKADFWHTHLAEVQYLTLCLFVCLLFQD